MIESAMGMTHDAVIASAVWLGSPGSDWAARSVVPACNAISADKAGNGAAKAMARTRTIIRARSTRTARTPDAS